MDGNILAFISLLRAGIWETGTSPKAFDNVDFGMVYKLAQEQSVVGLVAAGLEHVGNLTIPKQEAVPFMTSVINIEQRNMKMNSFIADLINKMRNGGIQALLVKGQGVAQCYERPLWRSAGDVDLFLDKANYEKAVVFCSSIARRIEEEVKYSLHLGMDIDGWEVELHGTMRIRFGKHVNKVLDSIQDDTFQNNNVRIWHNGGTDIYLPGAGNDVIFVFTHIIKHFFRGGIGLRQICDWCRLLWTFRGSIDLSVLESRIRSLGMMTEWRAFAALAVDYLGMPNEAMPLYSPHYKWHKKAGKILDFIFETGNFGHSRDYSYFKKYPYYIRKVISLWRNTKDSVRHFLIFPKDSFGVWCRMVAIGLKVTATREL